MSFGEYFQAFGGLGRSFMEGMDYAQQRRYEEEAAGLAGRQLDAYQANQVAQPQGGLSGLAPTDQRNVPLASLGAPRPPSFAGGQAAMTLPSSNKEIETSFIDSLRAGGLTNPNGLAAAAAYASHESRYSPKNITGSWSDPSESGQAGTSGGILSWRGPRLDAMRSFTAGAKDPVTAQAQFFLTENPALTMGLQNAKSPEEAHRLMADAWKFAGYNRAGGENAARLGSTRAYLDRLGGTGSGQPTAPSIQVAGAPLSLPPGASGMNPAYRPSQQAPVQVASNGPVDLPQSAPPRALIPQSMAGAGIPGTGMDRGVPVAQVGAPGAAPTPLPAPQQMADAAQADMPAPNARPAGFQIPPAPQPDFVPGTVASPQVQSGRQGDLPPVAGAPRLSPQQADYLRAQLRNPLTRGQAIQTIQGLNAPDKWETKELGGRVVQVNGRGDVRALPGFDKPEELHQFKGADGNDYLLNKRTGQATRLVQGKDDRFLDVTDPADRAAAGVPSGYAGTIQRGPDGKIYAPLKPTTEVNIDQKGETEFAKTAASGLGKRFLALSEEGDAARNDISVVGQIRALGGEIGTGMNASLVKALGDYGIPVGEQTGKVQAYSALIDKLTPAQRIPGAGATSDFDARMFKGSLPRLINSPEGNELIARTLEAVSQDKVDRARIAERALTGELKPAEAVAQLRALPVPNLVFKSGLSELQKAGKLSADAPQQPAQRPAPAEPVTAAPPSAAVDHLRSNPALRDAFDAKYGRGAADRALGGGRPGGVL